MHLFGVLVLMVTLSTVCGLKCYTCETTDPKACTKTETCPANADRCATLVVGGAIAKGCQASIACVNPIQCCEGDLCNSAMSTGSSVLLLLVSSAIIAVFL